MPTFAAQACWQYQRQLWDEVGEGDDPNRLVGFAFALLDLHLLVQRDLECSYHTWGPFGVYFVDGRGCQVFPIPVKRGYRLDHAPPRNQGVGMKEVVRGIEIRKAEQSVKRDSVFRRNGSSGWGK